MMQARSDFFPHLRYSEIFFCTSGRGLLGWRLCVCSPTRVYGTRRALVPAACARVLVATRVVVYI